MAFLRSLWDSTIGKKAIMAVTGVVLFGFVIGHLIGNLQIYIRDGGERIDAYGRFLHANPGLLWGARLFLLAALVLHVVTSIQLTARNRAARPVPYQVKDYREATRASRTMIYGGLTILLFVVYHLLHFTTLTVHRDLTQPLKVHDNVVNSFQIWWISGIYVLAQIFLGLHLFHGGWSMFQSLGLNHPKWTPALKTGMRGLAALIALGNISIPAAVLLTKWTTIPLVK